MADIRTDPQPPQWEDAAPGDNEAPQVFFEESNGSGKAGDAGANSRRVGWTLRDANGKILAGFGFKINPQGIDRQEVTRAQMFATRAQFLVDNFGPGPASISIRQLVGSGKEFRNSLGIPTQVYTAREDIQRFITTIYRPSIQRRKDPLQVYFHDNHFERGSEERVFWVGGGITLQRSVDLHNVWLVSIQMTSLEKNPYGDITVDRVEAPKTSNRPYIVKKQMSVTELALQLAGGSTPMKTYAKQAALINGILAANPQLLQKTRTVTIIDSRTGQPTASRTGARGELYPGERIYLPQ